VSAPYLDTHTAIVGASGAGKTVTAKGHVEYLLQAGRHVCILDPTGAWWGLRSLANGEGAGFDIPIFGGARGDVQISADQGEPVGAIIAGGVSAVIDISGLRTGSEQRQFARDLCRALRAKPDGNFHLVVDEADEFAAQKPRDDYGFQVGEELIWMAKRGRLAGFVLTLVTQRPASIDKEVLTQAQTLFVHQLVAPVDQKPIIDYLKDNSDKDTLSAIKSSLAGLDRGERWLYSPRLNLLHRGYSQLPSTFDSSRTPEPGEQAIEPKMLAAINLGDIRKKLAPPEGAKLQSNLPGTHNPDELLKSRIVEIEAERDAHKARADAAYEDGKRAGIAIGITKARTAIDALRIPEIAAWKQNSNCGADPDRHQAAGKTIAGRREIVANGKQNAGAAGKAPKRQNSLAMGNGETAAQLNTSARKMVEMLDRIAPARVPWGALAAMVGNKARGGNFNAARKAMRESGLIVEEAYTVRSNQPPADGMTREQARLLWKEVLSNPAPRMIDALDVRPMTRGELGAFLELVPRGGNFNNGVAQLLRNGVASEIAGTLHLTDPLPGQSK
jgi:hypothetical protein